MRGELAATSGELTAGEEGSLSGCRESGQYSTVNIYRAMYSPAAPLRGGASCQAGSVGYGGQRPQDRMDAGWTTGGQHAWGWR